MSPDDDFGIGFLAGPGRQDFCNQAVFCPGLLKQRIFVVKGSSAKYICVISRLTLPVMS
jgi:hypothetical protein